MPDLGKSINKYIIGLGLVIAAPVLQVPIPALEPLFHYWYQSALPAYLAGGYVYYRTWEDDAPYPGKSE